MRCINTNEYVCDECGYSVDSMPGCFPRCPVCGIEKTYISDNTQEKPGKFDPDDMRGL